VVDKVEIDRSTLVALLFVWQAFTHSNGFGEMIYGYMDRVEADAIKALTSKEAS